MQCSKPGMLKGYHLSTEDIKGVPFLLKVGFVRLRLGLRDEPSLITNFVNTHTDLLLIVHLILREGFFTK